MDFIMRRFNCKSLQNLELRVGNKRCEKDKSFAFFACQELVMMKKCHAIVW